MVAIRLAFLLTALTLGASSALALCSSDKQCPSSAPCCSQFGYCGSSSLHCLSGCDPLGSFKHSSCAPMPRCQNQHLDFTNHQTHHVDIADYHGDPNQAPMTLEGGNVRTAKTGLKLVVAKAKNDGDGGTTLSTTRYFYYGRTTVTMRHANHQGIVAAFITMSPTKDEIDWEMTTASKSNAQTNFYYHWVDSPDYDNGRTTKVPSDFTTHDWHAYTIDWSPSRMNFEIDGKVVRTVERSTTKSSNGAYNYPSTPSRIQLSIWDSDGMAKGTKAWTGGAPNWSQADSHGTFTSEIKSLDIQCHDPSHIESDATSYQWSKSMSKTTGQPKILGTKKSSVVN